MCPISRRREAWKRRKTTWIAKKLASMTQEIDLSEVPAAVAAILAGQVRGRIVVKVGGTRSGFIDERRVHCQEA